MHKWLSKKQNIFLFSTLFIIILVIGYLSYSSIPGDLLYTIKRSVYITQTQIPSSNVDKASLHLNHVKELLGNFTSVQKHNSSDPRLIAIAHEFAFNETLATQDLDK